MLQETITTTVFIVICITLVSKIFIYVTKNNGEIVVKGEIVEENI